MGVMFILPMLIDWYDSYKDYLGGWFGEWSDNNGQGFNWDNLRSLKKW